jgi:1-deoxy-D-xylulose-5-phosphate synthase
VEDTICAAALLEANHNLHAAVINARFVKPLDKELILAHAQQFDQIITVEENNLDGGFGSAILELLSENGIHRPAVKRIGIEDHFVEHGPQDTLRAKCRLDAKAIVQAALEMKEKGASHHGPEAAH